MANHSIEQSNAHYSYPLQVYTECDIKEQKLARFFVIFLLSIGLLGCYKDFQDLAEIDLKEIPFENPDLQTTGAQVSTFTAELDCPDGKPATFFAVYPNNPEPSHIAIIFHSGAFDFQDLENNESLHTPSHMTQRWSREKVWETLGMNIQTVESAETNTGALATALLDANVVQLYPANCWGDLWHNQTDETDNNYELENFNRSGRTFAYWMTQLIENPNFPGISGFQISQPYDSNNIYWIGLGNGGRAIAELLQRGVEPPKAIMLDSVPSNLLPYREAPLDFVEENLALDRIFGVLCETGISTDSPEYREECFNPVADMDADGVLAEDDCNDTNPDIGTIEELEENEVCETLTNITGFRIENNLSLGTYSLSQTTGGVERLALLWSDGDSQVPYESLIDAGSIAESEDWASQTWAHNTHEIGHVFSNKNIAASRQIVDFLINGNIPAETLFSDETVEE